MSGIIQFLRRLGSSLTGLFGLIHSLWEKVVNIKDKTLHLFDNISRLCSDIHEIIKDFQDFSVDPQWNSRVISAPRVLDNVHSLMEIPFRVVNDIKDLSRILKEKIEPAEVDVSDIEGIERVPAKLVKAGERVLVFAGLILDSLITIENALDDFQDIADSLRDVLENFQGLDGLFLPQDSRKKTVDEHYRKRLRS